MIRQSKKKRLDNIDKSIGLNIKKVRHDSGLSLASLSVALDISYQQISNYEKGRSKVPASFIFEMSEILKLSPMNFYEGLDNPDYRENFLKNQAEIVGLYNRLPSDALRDSFKEMMESLCR